jgi:hypothetical protein
VRKLLVVSATTALLLPLLAQSASTQYDSTQKPIATVRRAGPPKGPVPRLPSGMVDLMDATWTGGGPVNDLEGQGGMKKGELDALLLPWAKALMATRDETAGSTRRRSIPPGTATQSGRGRKTRSSSTRSAITTSSGSTAAVTLIRSSCTPLSGGRGSIWARWRTR